MDSSGVTSPYKDRWDADGDGRSPRSTKRDSPESLRRREDENEDGGAEKNRSWHSDSERGQLSEDGGRSPPSFYSDDYDSPSGGPKSPYSQSTLSSHSPHRRKQAKTTSSTAITRKGAHICLKLLPFASTSRRRRRGHTDLVNYLSRLRWAPGSLSTGASAGPAAS